MATKKRKTVQMLVKVSIPADKSAAWARREVSNLINHGAGWETYAGESVKARKVAPMPSKPTA